MDEAEKKVAHAIIERLKVSGMEPYHLMALIDELRMIIKGDKGYPLEPLTEKEKMTTETKHTPFREALMKAWVQGWYSMTESDDGKHATADEIIKDFPVENAAPETAAERDKLKAINAELLEATRHGLSIAESWVHDQLDGTSNLGRALAELEPIRAAISKATK